MLNLIVDLLRSRQFTGRLEIRFEGRTFGGTKVLWFAIAAGGSSAAPFNGDKEWWFSLLRDLRSRCERDERPIPLRRSGRIRRTSMLRSLCPDLLVAVEFASGCVTGMAYGELCKGYSAVLTGS